MQPVKSLLRIEIMKLVHKKKSTFKTNVVNVGVNVSCNGLNRFLKRLRPSTCDRWQFKVGNFKVNFVKFIGSGQESVCFLDENGTCVKICREEIDLPTCSKLVKLVEKTNCIEHIYSVVDLSKESKLLAFKTLYVINCQYINSNNINNIIKKKFVLKNLTKCIQNVGEALKYLHQDCNLVHGDIYERNIMWNDDKQCFCLIDFANCMWDVNKEDKEPFTINSSRYPWPLYSNPSNWHYWVDYFQLWLLCHYVCNNNNNLYQNVDEGNKIFLPDTDHKDQHILWYMDKADLHPLNSIKDEENFLNFFFKMFIN